MTITVPFGLNEAIPANAKVAWGARFIVNADGYVDLPPDRHGIGGDQALAADLLDRMQRALPLPNLRGLIRDMLYDGEIDTREAGQVILADDLGVKIVGDSKASAGYFYVAAFRTDAEMDEEAAL